MEEITDQYNHEVKKINIPIYANIGCHISLWNETL